MNRHFNKEDIWMVDKPMKRFSSHQSIGKCKLKPRLLEWLKLKLLTIPSVVEDVEELYCQWECKIEQNIGKTLAVSCEVKHTPTI